MLFDQPPAELPVAVVMPKSRRTQLVAGASAWFAARWRWFRPRTVPMIAAFVGMCAVVAFANYLKTYGRDDAPPERLLPATPTEVAAQPGKVVIEQGPNGADITIDGEQMRDLPELKLLPSHCGFTTIYK